MIKDLMKKFIEESKHFLKIGIPIFGSQLSYMIMHTTDTIVSGQYDSKELAGLVLANAFTFPIYMLFQGIMFAITPIVAQLFGSREFQKIGQKMRQIFWVAIMNAFLVFFIFIFFGKILPYFPLDKEILTISSNYLQAVSVGMFFYIMFRFLSSYSEGMTLTLPVFYVVLFGALINIPLDIIFAFGYFGVPEMGSAGCGYATSIISMIMFFLILKIILSNKLYKKTELLKEFDGPQFLQVITKKGAGLDQAETDRIGFHAIGKINSLKSNKPKQKKYQDVFSDWIVDMASFDENLIGITPAMREGS